MKPTIKTVLIGPGRSPQGSGIGAYMARELMRRPEIDLVALLGRDYTRLQQAQYNFNQYSDIVKPFSGELLALDQLDTILQRDDIQLCVVCSPDATHADYTIRALKHGKHVLVEKSLIDPASPQLEQQRHCHEMLRYAQQHKRQIFTNVQRMALIPTLLEKFDIDPAIQRVSIIQRNRMTNSTPISPQALLRLSISHPLSLLVGLGVMDQGFNIHQFNVTNNPNITKVSLNGSAHNQTGNVDYHIELVQALDATDTTVEITLNNHPVQISLLVDQGEITTKLKSLKYDEQSFVCQDALALFVDSVVKKIATDKPTRFPLGTDASIAIHKMQQHVDHCFSESQH